MVSSRAADVAVSCDFVDITMDFVVVFENGVAKSVVSAASTISAVSVGFVFSIVSVGTCTVSVLTNTVAVISAVSLVVSLVVATASAVAFAEGGNSVL